MTEETPASLEGGPIACPFVAFEDDRDHRSSAPDFRHRCFAAAEPEPRAFPHQERYCLAADFPQCPIFLDWARQEAAGVRQPSAASATGTTVGPEGSGLAAAGTALAGEAAPSFLAGRSQSGPATATSTPRSAEAAASLWSHDAETKRSYPSAPPAPSSLGAPAVAMARRGPSHPGWENPPRLENFPRLRSREDRHTNQLLLYAAIGVSILMVALIMIPIIPILTSQKGSTGAASQSPGASASQSAAIASALASGSSQPGPGSSAGYLRHIVKPNENLFTIAFQNGLKVCEVQMANPGQLDNPDYIQVGQVILLPPAGLLTCPSASPSRS